MILVIGGKGFVGRNVCKELEARERSFECIDLPEFDVTNSEQCLELFHTYPVSTIVNCAAMSHVPSCNEDPRQAFDVNTMGTLNLLQYCKWFKLKYVHVSTESIHNPPYNIYATTKACAELLVAGYRNNYDVSTVIIRTSSVYGPYDTHPRLVSNLIGKALRGETLEVFGSLEKSFNFTFVKDLAWGIVSACFCDEAVGKDFSITGGKLHTLGELLKIIKKHVPGTLTKLVAEDRKLVQKRKQSNIDVAGLLFGYKPQYTLSKGIKEIIDEYKVPQNR